MAMVYEVWDTLTANRIGAFPTRHDAEALLLDVLQVNGAEAAQDMAVLSSDTDAPDEEPELVIDGAEFVAHHQLPV
ncbi:MAG: hypothetical protein ACJ8BC_03195 [Gemmatimonadales bacterium]